MRKWISLLWVGVVFTVAAGGPMVITEDGPLGRQAEAATPAKPADVQPFNLFLPIVMRRYLAGYQPPFGIDMYEGNSPSDGQGQMVAAGSGWEVVTLYWSLIEPTAPISGVHSYDWSSFDADAARAQAANMKLFVLFNGNPAWAAALPGGPVTNTADLTSIAAAAADRYDGDGLNDAPGSPVINYWSFYGEPDNGDLGRAKGGKGYWGNNPQGYSDMIYGVSAAIRAANPNAVVLIGGVAYDNFTPTGPFVKSFLNGVLSHLKSDHHGVTPTLGAVAFHYYPINTATWPTIKEKAVEIRSIMIANGAGNLPLMVPEMGYWSTVVPNNSSFDSSEPRQAQQLVEMYVRGLSVGIRQMSWLGVFDFDNTVGTETHGLFRGQDLGQPKPSYTAYTTLTNELFGANYASAISAPGLEGYVFNMPGGQTKTVIWATQSAPTSYVFHQTCVRRVDYMGNITNPLVDGSVGDLDPIAGQITLGLLQDQPIYVGGC